jgi:hypothetical protein
MKKREQEIRKLEEIEGEYIPFEEIKEPYIFARNHEQEKMFEESKKQSEKQLEEK